MTDPTDRCLNRGHSKTASPILYLQEELGDARLRCDQLVRYVDEAVKLVERSDQKDHLFEVAGHLIRGIPESAFKLQKALQAVALAADRIDYEELKQELRPEKVEELERVLQEVRIRTVPHRSFPTQDIAMHPKQAAQQLREFVRIAREEGQIPVHEVAAFLTKLDPPGVTASQEITAADKLEKLAEMLEDPNQEPLSRVRLAAVVRRVAMEATVDDAVRLAAQQPDEEGQSKTALQLSPSIPALFEGIKDKAMRAMRAANSEHWRPAFMQLFFIVDDIGTLLVQMGGLDTTKSEALKREIRQALPTISHGKGDPAEMAHMASEGLAWDVEATEEKRTKFEEGKPADPTENMDKDDAAKWKDNTDQYGDKFKAARFQEGESADPTQNMSPEDAKEWEEQNEQNKDNFKQAGGVEDSFVRRLKKHEKEIGMGSLSALMQKSGWQESVREMASKLFQIEGKLPKEQADRKAKDWVKPSMFQAIKDGLTAKTASVDDLIWKA